MERHRCKLCHRRFSNGRALGGHMRSHVKPAHALPQAAAPSPGAHVQLPSRSVSSSSFSAAAGPEEKVALTYGLRENPRKSFRLADPEFSASFAAAAGSSSVVQDGESDTESSLRRRPKWHHRVASTWDLGAGAGDAEPLSSSVSDASPEEDVARSLMLLSCDRWARFDRAEERQSYESADYEDEEEKNDDDDDEEEAEEDEERRGEVAVRAQRRKRTSYQCCNCRKVFRSYQALGGHRASHKRVGVECVPTASASGAAGQIHGSDEPEANAGDDRYARVFQCPYCVRVFSSGQALGGHKRSHFVNSAANSAISHALLPSPRVQPPSIVSAKSSRLDLNFPAPLEEEAELSAVSVAMDFPSK